MRSGNVCFGSSTMTTSSTRAIRVPVPSNSSWLMMARGLPPDSGLAGSGKFRGHRCSRFGNIAPPASATDADGIIPSVSHHTTNKNPHDRHQPAGIAYRLARLDRRGVVASIRELRGQLQKLVVVPLHADPELPKASDLSHDAHKALLHEPQRPQRVRFAERLERRSFSTEHRSRLKDGPALVGWVIHFRDER